MYSPSPEPSSLLDDFPLDIAGQGERINRLYTQITFCFPLPDDSEGTCYSQATEALIQGLSRVEAAFPWTAGHVVRDKNGEFHIKSSPTTQTQTQTQPQQRLLIRDLRGNPFIIPNWDDLQENQFPFHMLDEEVIAPCKTMVASGAERPVLVVQANLIQGGLLLTVNAQHGSMDMAGQAQVIALLAKAMRGEAFSKAEIEGGNVTRRDVIPLLPEGVPPPKANIQQEAIGNTTTTTTTHSDMSSNSKMASAQQTGIIISPVLVWAYLAFPADSLTRLKSFASKDIPHGTFISRDDVLTAFVWQAMGRARAPRRRLPDRLSGGASTTTTTTSTLTRNVDVRKHFHLPPTYPGSITTATSHTLSLENLLQQRSLGAIAADLRAALQDPDSLKRGLQVQATSIARDRKEQLQEAKAKAKAAAAAAQKSISATTKHPLRLDVRLSSWAKEGLYDVDFGPCLGKPEAVRRPRFREGAREGLVYFLPRARDGEIVVGVCLEEEDMQRLKVSPQVAEWARWIG